MISPIHAGSEEAGARALIMGGGFEEEGAGSITFFTYTNPIVSPPPLDCNLEVLCVHFSR